MYAADNDDYVPRVVNAGGDEWMGRLFPYVGVDGVDLIGYWINGTTAANYKKLQGTVFDCPSVPGPSVDPSAASVDNFYRYNYAMSVTPNMVMANAEHGFGAGWGEYEKNKYNPRMADMERISETVSIGETNGAIGPPKAMIWYNSYQFRFIAWYSGPAFIDWYRHPPACNWAFYDGHVEPMDNAEFWSIQSPGPQNPYGHGWPL